VLFVPIESVGGDKKEIIKYWSVTMTRRQNGDSAGKRDYYFFNGERQCRSRLEVASFYEHASPLHSWTYAEDDDETPPVATVVTEHGLVVGDSVQITGGGRGKHDKRYLGARGVV